MATATAGTLTVPVDKIHVPDNVRDLDPEHVEGLAGSIALQGLLAPVTVAPATGTVAEQGYDYELVAGFHRFAAVIQLGHAAIDVVVRVGDGDGDADVQSAAVATARATENIVRKQLNAHEEAIAVKAMLDRGLTEDGAAVALNWSKARITARVRLLELPELAQQMVGDGRLALSAVEPLRTIGAVSQDVLDCVVNHIAGDGYGAGRFSREPGWVTAQALQSHGGIFGAFLDDLSGYEVVELKLGKRATAQYEEITELAKQLDRYSYGGPRVPFIDTDVDQARAAGVLIEFENAKPVIVDRSLYRELAKQAIKRHVATLTERVAQQAEQKKAAKAAGRQAPANPLAEAKREHGRQMRQLAEQAHGVNTDLGWALRNGLSVVDPEDLNVARFFVYALLEGDSDGAYGNYGERARDLAARGIRLVIDEFRADVTKTRKDGSRGALRIDYGKQHESKPAREWLFKYVDGAKTAGELYGRALVVIAAEKYALRMVVPASQQHTPLSWSSHKDQAEKALSKIVGPHLPATLKQLEKAVSKAKAAYEQEQNAIRKEQLAKTAAERPTEPSGGEVGDVDDEYVDEFEDVEEF